MEFRPYPKMSTDPGPPPGGTFSVTEKIHGAHLALLVDGENVQLASRKRILPAEDWPAFFGVDSIYPRLHMIGLQLAQRCLPFNLAGVPIYCYGELFGTHVQDMAYGRLDWRVFDILVGEHRWLHGPERRTVAGEYAVPCLAVGNWAEINHIAAVQPSRLNPDIDAEGIVVQSELHRWQQKRKHPDFRERSSRNPFGVIDPQAATSAWLLQQAMHYYTPSRIASARSKLGQVSDAVLQQEIVQDMLTDIADDIGELTVEQYEYLQQSLTDSLPTP